MAGKWEIAKALGRAVTRPGASKKTVKTIAKAVDDPSDLHAYFKFREGRAAGEQDALDSKLAADEAISDAVVPESKRTDAEQIIFDKFTNADTEQALQQDFDEAFDELTKKRASQIAKRADFIGAEPLDEATAAYEDIVRKDAIELLKSGKSIEDVLDMLKTDRRR